MAFKMTNPPYITDNTPIYSTDMDDNILGMAQSNGSILINKNVSPLELKKSKTVEHEMVHIDQMRRGDLDYNDTHVIWKGKKYPRSKMNEGAKNLPWEKEAYIKQDKSPFRQEKNFIDKINNKIVEYYNPPLIKDKKQRDRDLDNYIKKSNHKITQKKIDTTRKKIEYTFNNNNK